MTAVQELLPVSSVVAACAALRLPRATYYRRVRPRAAVALPRPACGRALTLPERAVVLDTLHSARFVDQAPREIYAQLLDEGQYLCSPRTMYRLLEAALEIRERRAQLRHPQYRKPELLATAPNQVWTWDITKLRGPQKWTYFHLYVLVDLFSRCVVGWLLARREDGNLAAELIETTLQREGIVPGQVTIHADRGAAMTSKTVAQLYDDLGVQKSFSRPHVSDDNPFSEAHFKTLKYRSDFPDRFGSLAHARAHCRAFFDWYNHRHHHTGIGLMTPAVVHGREDTVVQARRQQVVDAAAARHPERFVRGRPRLPQVPAAVWINPPQPREEELIEAQ
jgi:putative transposase